MNLTEFKSTGRDQFGRKYPIKVVLKDGRVLFGHIKAFSTASDIVFFRVIPNIDEYRNNINNEIGDTIEFNSTEIQEISVYKNL
jgi:small nuclear ribonucleoprotein (snRNP)-like protein